MRLVAMVLVMVMMCTPITLGAYGDELVKPTTGSKTTAYKDVPADHWANAFIADAINRKVLKGYPDGKFRPDSVVSRAEFSTIMCRVISANPVKPTQQTFSDVGVNDWYAPYVNATKDYMIFYDYGGGQVFEPNTPIVREHVATALAKWKGHGSVGDVSLIEGMFTDCDTMSESVKPYVALAVENQLMSGYPDETFRAQEYLTRAEVAAVFWKASKGGNVNATTATTSTAVVPVAVVPATPVVTPTVIAPVETPSVPVVSVPVVPTTPVTPTAPVVDASVPVASGKITVEKLTGINSAGLQDGPLYQAKTNYIHSIATGDNGDIYFLDGNKARTPTSMRIRKISNGVITTLKAPSAEFDFNYTFNGNRKALFSGSEFEFRHLAYYNGKLHVLGGLIKTSSDPNYPSYPDQGMAVFEVTPSVRMVTYEEPIVNGLCVAFWDTFAPFNGYPFFSSNVSVCRSYSSSDSYRFYYGNGKQASRVITNNAIQWSNATGDDRKYRHIATTQSGNGMLIATRTELKLLTLSPYSLKVVANYANMNFTSVSAFNGKVYATFNSAIHEISADGSMKLIVKHDAYESGTSGFNVNQLTNGTNGDIIAIGDGNIYKLGGIK